MCQFGANFLRGKLDILQTCEFQKEFLLFFLGDWLKEVNGEAVSWDNLDSILLNVRIPSAVTLSVQKCAVDTLPTDDHLNLRVRNWSFLFGFCS